MKNRLGLFGIVFLCLLGFAGFAESATVNLAVNPNTESDWAKDRLYQASGSCATPGNFVMVKEVPRATSITFSVTISADGTYCFESTAVDNSSNESIFSNRVEVTIDTVPPAAPTSLTITSVTKP